MIVKDSIWHSAVTYVFLELDKINHRASGSVCVPQCFLKSPKFYEMSINCEIVINLESSANLRYLRTVQERNLF